MQRNQGFEFICDCLEFNLPAYGLEYKSTENEEKNILNFIRSLEKKVDYELRIKIHQNLVMILNYISKLRPPSLLQVIIMDSLCRAIVPEQSQLSHPSRNEKKELVISLETISFQNKYTTFDQLLASYQHYYIWIILASISNRIKFDTLGWLNFPYMVTTLMFVFGKYCENIPGFQDYSWEDKNQLSFIGFCKKSYNIMLSQYNNILNDKCNLIEYTTIQKNLMNLNEIFKKTGFDILSGKEILSKIEKFGEVVGELKKILILELEIENKGISSTFLLNILNNHQIPIPEGINAQIHAIFDLSSEHNLYTDGIYGIIKFPKARDTIKLKDLRIRCTNLVDEFEIFSYPIFENSNYSVHQFLAHFRIRENVLVDACLKKCIAEKMKNIHSSLERRIMQFLSMDQFIACVIECFRTLKQICEGGCTFAEIDQINKKISLKYLDFDKIRSDITLFPPLTAHTKDDFVNNIDVFQFLKKVEYITVICDICKQFKLYGSIASLEYELLEFIHKRLSNSDTRDHLTFSEVTTLLAYSMI